MRRFWPLLLFSVFFIISCLAIVNQQDTGNEPTATSSPQRIITLAPNITEMAFAVGLGDRIVGVTDYCEYPAATNALPKVGGFVNPNIEQILSLQPDLVILFDSQQKVIHQLEQLHIPTLTLSNKNLLSITENIAIIGQRTAHQQQAELAIKQFNDQIDIIKNKLIDVDKPKVMVAMGHSLNTAQLGTIYIAGNNDFYHELIELAGGQNVFHDARMKLPSLSTEGIIALNPDIIFDIFPEADDHNLDIALVKQQWLALTNVTAVANRRVHIIEEDYATIPGQRIVKLLAQMAALIHPDKFASND